MNAKHSYGRRQLLALAAVIFLSPALRLFPAGPARVLGRAAWISPLAAAPLLLLYGWFLFKLMAARREGEGLADLSLRILGEKPGRAVLCLFSVWLLLYAGFVLRSGADRFITTIYPLSAPPFFTLCMGAAALVGALGSCRSLVRVAKLVLPIVLGVIVLILFFSLFGVDKSNLLPVTRQDLAPVPLLQGSLSVADVISVALYLTCFLAGPMPKKEDRLPSFLLWLGLICLLLTAVSVAVVGSFGAELTARLTRPFFSLVRNLVFFSSLGRIEALVVALWVFPDFLLVSLLLFAAQYCLRLAAGYRPSYQAQRRLDFSGGRWTIWLCGAAAILCGLLIARDPASLSFWSETLIPLLNLSFAFLLLPLLWAAGRLRKRL